MVVGGDSVVMVVVGDFFWRRPMLFGSIFVVVGYCLSFGLLRCYMVF